MTETLVQVFMVVMGIVYCAILFLGIHVAYQHFKPKVQEKLAKRRAWKETKEFIKKL